MDRRTALAIVLVVAGTVALASVLSAPGADRMTPEERDAWRANVTGEPELATFAAGCFWCIEAVYDSTAGVGVAISGYAGGSAETATYEQVLTGTTGHREAVRVKYFPSVVSYPELLDLFWRSIDPTDAGGQFADRGPQYTTAIYAHTPRQYRLALGSRRNVSERFSDPIATEVVNVTTFFPAEDYHQNYSRKSAAAYEAYKHASGRTLILPRIWDWTPFG